MWKSWSLIFDDRTPIYRQIIIQYNQAFVRGDIQPGERIPSIREASGLLKVNTNTIQHAYQEMEREGLIISKRGTGYFFTDDPLAAGQISRRLTGESIRRFVEEMRALKLTNEEIREELASYLEGDGQDGKGPGDYRTGEEF